MYSRRLCKPLVVLVSGKACFLFECIVHVASQTVTAGKVTFVHGQEPYRKLHMTEPIVQARIVDLVEEFSLE